MTEEKIPKLQFGMFLKIDGFVRLNTRMKKVKVISKSIHSSAAVSYFSRDRTKKMLFVRKIH